MRYFEGNVDSEKDQVDEGKSSPSEGYLLMSEKGNIGDGNSINPDPDPESIILNELRNRVKTNNQPIKRYPFSLPLLFM